MKNKNKQTNKKSRFFSKMQLLSHLYSYLDKVSQQKTKYDPIPSILKFQYLLKTFFLVEFTSVMFIFQSALYILRHMIHVLQILV